MNTLQINEKLETLDVLATLPSTESDQVMRIHEFKTKLIGEILDDLEGKENPNTRKLGELIGLNNELQPKDLETILNEFVKVHSIDVSQDAIKHYASRIMYMFPEFKNQRKILERFVSDYQKSDLLLNPFLEQFIKYNNL